VTGPAMSLRLTDPLSAAVGRGTAEKFASELAVRTVGDLLRHFPRRYEKYGELTTIRDLPLGQEVSLVAEVVSATTITMKSRPGVMLKVTVTDGRDHLPMTFFNARRIASVFRPGTRMLFSGTVGDYKRQLQLTHPKWTQIHSDDDPAVGAVDTPFAIYPSTARLTQTAIRTTIGMVLDVIGEQPDPLPVEIRARLGLPALSAAFEAVHRPAEIADGEAALKRFTYEEAFVLQVALARRRASESAAAATPRPQISGGLLDAFTERLPFALTAGQREVGEQIAADLAAEHPMHRLLQGEVGSGKTVVAVRAMLTVVDGGGQAALLAPTEVLAAQHHRSISSLLGELAEGGLLGGERGTRVVLLTGSMSAAARRAALLEIVSGDAGIVIGTHALLQERVSFCDLGLVVVDEQHRFGVEQRDLLRGKARTSPHLLVMTATPIPRTVAMTVFGDLETSTLTEVPAGRPAVSSHVVALAERPGWYRRVWERLREEIERGHQAYVVCPRIDGDGHSDQEEPPGEDTEEEPSRRPLRAVAEVVEQLRAEPALAGLRIEALHGRIPAEERERVMAAFAAGQVHVLVATTVIEVGVDVPNATAMVVLDADRFGISQLHQLRGRVGRGVGGGVCLLVSDAETGTGARERLDVVASTTDGFALARADLDQRREGDVLGANQSGGKSSLRRLRVLRDEDTIVAARHEATALVAADPDLSGHPALAQALAELLDAEQAAYLERG